MSDHHTTTTGPKVGEEHLSAAELIAVAFGYSPEQAGLLLATMDSEDVSVDVDLTDAELVFEGACGFGRRGDAFAQCIRDFDATPRQPIPSCLSEELERIAKQLWRDSQRDDTIIRDAGYMQDAAGQLEALTASLSASSDTGGAADPEWWDEKKQVAKGAEVAAEEARDEALIARVLERFRPSEAWWDMGDGHRQGVNWHEVVGIVLAYGGALPVKATSTQLSVSPDPEEERACSNPRCGESFPGKVTLKHDGAQIFTVPCPDCTGNCSTCGTTVSLAGNGTVEAHRAPEQLSGVCFGTGKPPRDTGEEPGREGEVVGPCADDCGCPLPAMVRDDGTCSGCGAQVVPPANPSDSSV